MPVFITVVLIVACIPLLIGWQIIKAIYQAANKPKREARAQAEREARAAALCSYFEHVNEARAFPDILLTRVRQFVPKNCLFSLLTSNNHAGFSVDFAKTLVVARF
ncbi:hypothetical protein QU487_22280 [Crenobacter sp. SG2305]|uniref:hypothetical protein n=1 Tax=Crenobacter oryzisoli TaxID=3056844 RepID=UPI0025AAE67C|nr:hypothetical protein [Crenobacter sp. SG2305]MDN0085431.1 hypothetical protein [Crenobacter sp. SG2305]